MAEPTTTQAGTDLAYLLDPFDHLEQSTSDGTSGWVKLEEDYRTQVRGRLAQAGISGIRKIAATLALVLSQQTMRAITRPAVRQLALSFDSSLPDNASDEKLFREIYDGFVTGTHSINSPGDTYDAFATDGNVVTGGSIVGDGVVERLTVDENNFPLEGWIPDTYQMTVTGDATTNGISKHRERFQLSSTKAHPNKLKEDGAGLTVRNIFGMTAAESAKWVRNPSFNEYTGDVTTLPGWSTASGASDFSNLSIDTTNTFRDTPGQSVSAAITFDTDETLYPHATEGIKPKYNRDLPYIHAVRGRRNGSATGTVTLRLSGTVGSGGVSASVSLGSLTADTWTTLKIAIGQNCWPTNFGDTDLKLQIAASSLSGTCNVDEIIVGAMTRVGARRSAVKGRGGMGQYAAAIGGQTPWRTGDQYEAVDTQGGTRGVVHKWLTRVAEWGYLPSNGASSETISDR